MPQIKHAENKQPATKPTARSARKPYRVWSLVTMCFAGAAAWSLSLLFPMGVGDHVTREEIEDRARAFERIQEFPVLDVPPAEVTAALSRLPLEAPQKSALSKALATPSAVPTTASPLRLAQITVWDTHQQDGDVVAIASGAFRIQVPLTIAPQTISVPVDGSSAITVTGVRDGGGGITLGIRGANAVVLMPIMSEGQTLTLQVR